MAFASVRGRGRRSRPWPGIVNRIRFLVQRSGPSLRSAGAPAAGGPPHQPLPGRDLGQDGGSSGAHRSRSARPASGNSPVRATAPRHQSLDSGVVQQWHAACLNVGQSPAPPASGGKEATMRIAVVTVLIGLLFALSVGAQQPAEKLGTVNFPTSCNAAAQAEFTRAVALLHSFWFSYAIKGFEAAAQADPSCGIAYWGAAVARMGNPLAGAPPAKDLELGATTVARAKSVGAKTQRELDYIGAIETFYKDSDKVDHRTRAQNYEKAMEALAARYPQDKEAAIFYALALNMTLNPNDKTYANQ